MGFKDKKEFTYRVYTRGSTEYPFAHIGVFGWKDYYFLWRASGEIVYLRKYRFPNILLWERRIYRHPGHWEWALGAGVVTSFRIYFFRLMDQKVGWIEHKDDIGDYPTFHPILSVGSGSGNLQGYPSVAKWSALLYKDAYLFHCDVGAHRILVTDLDGEYIGEFGSYGSLHGQFKEPHQCALYKHPVFGDILFIADFHNGRITVWQIESLNPFKINPLAGGIEGLTDDNRPRGVAIWRNQLYVRCHNHKVKEFKINSDLTLEATGNEDSFDSDWSSGMCMYLAKDYNHLVTLVHEYTSELYAIDMTAVTYSITAVENIMEGSVGFNCDALSFGIENNFNFSIRAGQQGVWKAIPFSVTAEGQQQRRIMNAGFGFSCSVKHDICAVIQSIPFSIKVRQRQIEESLPFSFLGHCNYMLGSAQLSLMADIISNVFLSGENVFTFNMIANSPLTFKTELTLEVPEAEGTLVNDTIALFNLILPEFILLIQQAFKVECELSCIQPSGKLASPSYMSSTLSLFSLQLQSSMEVPHSFSGQAVLNTPSITALSYQPDLLSANITLSSLKTNGIAYQGFDYAKMELTIELLSVSSQMAIIPFLHAFISLPALEIDAHEGGQIASIEEIYQNSSLTLVSGEYPQVDGVELLGVAINLLNKSISRIANTDYMIIDLGYLDLHKGVVNQYLEVFISGYTPNQNQPIGELQIGSYTYLIEEWVTENEWRVLIGKGLTRKTTQNTDKRFIPIKLKLKPDFELRSVTIRATPVARRGR